MPVAEYEWPAGLTSTPLPFIPQRTTASGKSRHVLLFHNRYSLYRAGDLSFAETTQSDDRKTIKCPLHGRGNGVHRPQNELHARKTRQYHLKRVRGVHEQFGDTVESRDEFSGVSGIERGQRITAAVPLLFLIRTTTCDIVLV